MKGKKNAGQVMAFIIMALFVSTGLFAQKDQEAVDMLNKDGKSPRDAYTEADMPQENYLARFHAIEVTEKLLRENLEKIYMFKVIKNNFKDDHSDWTTDYDKVYAEYKEGVDLYYRRNVVYSREKLESNRKSIDEAYKKIAEAYRVDTIKMLGQCADMILELSLNPNTRTDPNKSRELFDNQMRLSIAYAQLDEANNMFIELNYYESIAHFRNAKAYAILILEEIDPANQKGKYDKHKADNLNRILGSAKTTSNDTTKPQ